MLATPMFVPNEKRYFRRQLYIPELSGNLTIELENPVLYLESYIITTIIFGSPSNFVLQTHHRPDGPVSASYRALLRLPSDTSRDKGSVGNN